MSDKTLLRVEGLSTWFHGPDGSVRAVDDVSLHVDAGETVALVGESGSGKTACGLSIMRLIREPGQIMAGRIHFEGLDLLSLPEQQMRAIRGDRIAMVFQEAGPAFDPTVSIGEQIVETLVAHRRFTSRDAKARAVELLRLVDIADPERRYRNYPHEFSGGMLQRAMIALAISCEPRLLIADEPTTSLDSTTQAQILELLRGLSRRLGMAVLLVTHNFGIVARYADRAYVMYQGKIVEEGSVAALYAAASHPYTRRLWASARHFQRPGDRSAARVV